MKVTLSRRLWAHVACLSLWPVILFAGTPDPAINLSACKNGWPSCDHSRLTLTGVTEVALAEHARNVRSCRDGLNSCDHSKLTRGGAPVWAVALYARNVWNGGDAIPSAERTRLTLSEASEGVLAAG